MNFGEQIKSNCGKLPYDRIKISRFDQLELATILRGVLLFLQRGAATQFARFGCFATVLRRCQKPSSRS